MLPALTAGRLALSVGLSLAVAGCGGGESTAPPATDFPPGRAAVQPLDGQLLFPVLFDDRPDYSWMVVDTGAVTTAVDETLVRELANGVGKVTIDLGEGLVLKDHRVFGGDLSKAEDYIGVNLHGLLGQDLFMKMFFGLDYRATEVTCAESLPKDAPPGFSAADAIDLPYTLEQLMPVVEVPIGDRTARLIADTGSGVTILTESFVPASLLEGGLRGYTWQTSYGSDPGVLVRLPKVSFGGAEVANEWAVVVPDDYHLKSVFEQLGVHVDGFLGYPVYRHFLLTVRGPESRYRAYRYPTADHLDAHEWDRVGVEVRRDAGEVVVDMVYEPSDAHTAGVLGGEVLKAIDGEALAGMKLDEVRRRLRGTPGETRALDLVRDGAALSLEVAVDRLLPPLF